MSRPLRTSERRVALLVGDGLAVTIAVLLALWTWSLTAGFPFDPAFLRARVVWLLAVPLWLLFEVGIVVASWLKPADKTADAG